MARAWLAAVCRGVLLGGIIASVSRIYDARVSVLDAWYEVLLVTICGLVIAILLVKGAGWRMDKRC